MSIDPALRTEFLKEHFGMFSAAVIEHPSGTMRLLDGDGFLIIGGELFRGFDPDVGTLGGLTVSDEGAGDQAPDATVIVHPINAAKAVDLARFDAQGAPVKIITGAFNPVTGLIVAEPYTDFIGEIDVPHLPLSSGAITFDNVSDFERFFEVDEGMQLSHAFQSVAFPGDLGCEYVTAVGIDYPWGSPGVRPTLPKA